MHSVCTGLFLPDCRWPSWFNWGAYPGRGKAGQTLHGEAPGWSSGNFDEDQMLWFDGKKTSTLTPTVLCSLMSIYCWVISSAAGRRGVLFKPWIPCFCGLQSLINVPCSVCASKAMSTLDFHCGVSVLMPCWLLVCYKLVVVLHSDVSVMNKWYVCVGICPYMMIFFNFL